LALNAGWDLDLLKIELDDLAELDFDLSLTGFSLDEIAGLTLGGAGLTDPDEAPEPPIDPISVPGDVWLLDRHRLVCGDCTDAGVVATAFNGVKPHLMVTDPPYGVDYDAMWRGHVRTANGKRLSLGVHAKGKVENDGKADWREAWVLFPGDVAYVWHAAMRVGESKESLEGAGFALRAQIIWAKNNFAISRGHYHFQHEPCWYAVRDGATGHWCGGHKQTSVWHIDKPQKSETGHSTQKPVECMKRPIENNSSPGQAVYDPFVGSRHDNHCRRDDRAGVPRDRNTSGICRLRGDPMAEFHGPRSDAGIHQQDICRDEAGSFRWFYSYGTPSKQESNQNQRC
jgi:hypothetical protein